MASRNKNTIEAARRNKEGFIQYYDRLKEISLSIFDWQNVPNTIDTRFLELTLFDRGVSVFFRDDVIGELALRCSYGGDRNVYDIPIRRRAHASNSYYRELNDTNSVLIFNNMLHTNSQLDIEIFARRLYNIDRIIDVNVNAQKTPVLISCDESQRLTLKNLYMKYDGNEPVIYGDKNINPNSLLVLKTDAPYMADKLYELKTQIWNEALTYIGVPNISTMKKERMLTDEVNRMQGGAFASRYSRINARKQACEQINRMFGLDIDCEYRDEFASDLISLSDGGEDDVEIYD